MQTIDLEKSYALLTSQGQAAPRLERGCNMRQRRRLRPPVRREAADGNSHRRQQRAAGSDGMKRQR